MRISSAKAKGRRACEEVKELLEKYAPDLREGDIRVTSSSVGGEDLLLSPRAKELYNFAVEVKNQESLNIWASFEQAETHVKGEETPILFYKRNRSELMVSLRAEDFVKLIR